LHSIRPSVCLSVLYSGTLGLSQLRNWVSRSPGHSGHVFLRVIGVHLPTRRVTWCSVFSELVCLNIIETVKHSNLLFGLSSVVCFRSYSEKLTIQNIFFNTYYYRLLNCRRVQCFSNLGLQRVQIKKHTMVFPSNFGSNKNILTIFGRESTKQC